MIGKVSLQHKKLYNYFINYRLFKKSFKFIQILTNIVVTVETDSFTLSMS